MRFLKMIFGLSLFIISIVLLGCMPLIMVLNGPIFDFQKYLLFSITLSIISCIGSGMFWTNLLERK